MENIYLGINFGHDTGISLVNTTNTYTVLSERVNLHKQSAEINNVILKRVLTEAGIMEKNI